MTARPPTARRPSARRHATALGLAAGVLLGLGPAAHAANSPAPVAVPTAVPTPSHPSVGHEARRPTASPSPSASPHVGAGGAPDAPPSDGTGGTSGTSPTNGVVVAPAGLTVRAYTPGATTPSKGPGSSQAPQPNKEETPATGLWLGEGVKVRIVCYYVGEYIQGPEAHPGPIDPYWDRLDLGAYGLPSGTVPVVADAWVRTGRDINNLVPPCTFLDALRVRP